jgi:hypothetical protein
VNNSAIDAATKATLVYYIRGWKDGNPTAKTYFAETRGGVTTKIIDNATGGILEKMNQWGNNVPGWVPVKVWDNVYITLSTARPYTDNTGVLKEIDGPEGTPYKWMLPGPAVTATLGANPISINKGSCSTITWTTNNATSVSIDQGIGLVVVNGSQQVCPTASTQYTITASNPGGPITAVALVAVNIVAPPSCSAPTGLTIVK